MKKGKLEHWRPLLNQPNLPSEILEDVLSRLPVDSLCRFRCVSKSWRGLVTDPRFIKIHLHHSTENNPKIIVSSGEKIFSIDFEARDGTSAKELDLPCHHLDSHIRMVGCCNGLICFKDTLTIYVWNPVTREHIKFRDDFSDRITMSTYMFIDFGFGYNPITDEYKVLRVVDCGYGTKESRAFVRTLGDNSWRSLGNFPYEFNTTTSGELLNGAIHWMACRGTSTDQTQLIVCFDFRDEKFREMLLPDFVNWLTPLRIAVLGGLLCICCYSEIKDCFEMWVMKEYSDEKSWTKQFSQRRTEFSGDIQFFKPLGFRRTGEILVQEGERSIALYDPVSKGIRHLNIHGIPNIYEVNNHLESLVSPMAGNILPGNEKQS